MAQKSKTTLKSKFETGDNPTQQEMYDLVESCVNQTDWHYFVKTVDTAEDTNGNWRQGFSGDNLITQKRKAGVWVTVNTYIF